VLTGAMVVGDGVGLLKPGGYVLDISKMGLIGDMGSE